MAQQKHREIFTWAQTRISEISMLKVNPTLINSLLETGGLVKASPQAKAKYNSSMAQIFGHSYKTNSEVMKFSDELLLRIANPNVAKVKTRKAGKNQKINAVSSKSYKVLLDKVTDFKDPGRKLCHCLCQGDCKLVANCLRCGNIVCTQQGPGPCLFCGEVVFSKEQREFFSNQTNKAREEEGTYLRKWKFEILAYFFQ